MLTPQPWKPAGIEAKSAESTEIEPDDDAACPISPESIIEAILFVGAPNDVKLTSRKIAAVLRDVSPKEVTKIAKQLNARYEAEDAAYRISTEKGDLRMVLADSLTGFQQEFFGTKQTSQAKSGGDRSDGGRRVQPTAVPRASGEDSRETKWQYSCSTCPQESALYRSG